MLSLSNKHVILGVVTVTTLLFLIFALPILGLNGTSIPSYGTIQYCANTRVGQFENGTYYVSVINGNGVLETVYKSADADEVINFAISISTGGTVFVAYTGSGYEIDNTINLKTNVTVVLDTDVELHYIATNGRSVKFNNVENAHLLGLGTAVISGRGLELIYANDCSVENLEIKDVSSQWLYVHHSNNNVFQNLYGHNWGKGSTYAQHGILLEDASGNKLINIISDGEHSQTTRTTLCVGGWEGPSYNNQIIGGEFKNCYAGNGIYLGGWQYPVENNTLTGFVVSGNTGSGRAGIKLRGSSYNSITGFISKENYNGIEVGTCYNSERAHSNSTGNVFEGVILDSISTGLILTCDGDNMSVRKNVFTLIIQGSGDSGVWISHDKATSIIKHNLFDLVCSDNVDDGIEIEIGTAGASVVSNYFKAVCINNGGYGVNLHGSQASYIIDNRFDVVLENNTLGDKPHDEGTRTRINGFGKEAAGVGNPPTASLWDIGDIVENTDDDTLWIKDYDGTMRKISL